MKVLFITRNFPPSLGGMEHLSFNLINYFPGAKVVIAMGHKRKINLVWFAPYALLLSFFYLPNVDLIHINDPALSFIGIVLKIFRKVPVVVNLHGLDLTYPCPLYQRYINFTLPRVDLCICISRSTKALAAKKKIKNLKIIPVGINTQASDSLISKKVARKIVSANFGISFKGRRVLLTVGRLVKRKGVAWFLENVFSRFGKDTLYLVVGEGNERSTIQAIIKNKKLDGRVFFLGQVKSEVLPYIYRSADIFVMPNIEVNTDTEGFGVVALEAALHEVPVVASDIDGIRDAVKNGRNGILLRPGDKGRYYSTISKLIKYKRRGLNLGRKARAFTLRKYNWNLVSKKYYSSFERIL